ncbi:MAG: type II toxin-antitoxin system PemK/MazF family toxin [Schleiferilactobacillus harbinensis]|jgi:mRNA interferase MazF|nr:type II toxin-antitoxin system PemK/MazF family toxin [Schleiferilactobacillus harbinensis]
MAVKMLIIRQGSVYWVDTEPHAGREEGGHSPEENNDRRPVVVVSNNQYNGSGIALVFPITTKKRRSRYLLPIQLKKPSQIILTQILGYDMVARNAEYTGVSVSDEQLEYLKQIFIHTI